MPMSGLGEEAASPRPSGRGSRVSPSERGVPSGGSLPVTRALELVRVEELHEPQRPILGKQAAEAVDALIEERQRGDALRAAGLNPTRTVLLTGPPGVGKTMTARYLAAAMNKPLISVDLAAVMSSFLGKTGQNLREVLDYARSNHCVLLLDEFDALAKRRDDQTDVGELKRIVNVLLLELEDWPPEGLLVAATNHPELLDRAIWRRFEVLIEIGFPDAADRKRIICEMLGEEGLSQMESPAVVDLLALTTEGASGSELGRMIGEARRSSIIKSRALEEVLVDFIHKRLETGDVLDRPEIARIASEKLGWSQRTLGHILGVSHVTIGKWIKKRARAASPEPPRVE